MTDLPAPDASGSWNRTKLAQAAALLDDWIRDGRLQGASLLVTQGPRRFARNFGTARGTEPVFLLASLTKPMTAAAVMSLVDSGELSLDDCAARFFPSFAGEGREAITIRHLLTHTAGLPDMLPGDEALRERHAALAVYRDGALAVPLKFVPGSHYAYSSIGILLASEIAQQVSGKPIADLMEERVFRPLGMHRSSFGLRGRPDAIPSQSAPAMTEAGRKSWHGWNWNSGYWRNLGAPWGGALGSAADVERFCREFLDLRGRSLKPATAQMMITNQSPPGIYASGLGFDLPPGIGAPMTGPRTFGHNGATGTLSWADPGTGTVCVVLTTLYEAAVRPHPMHLASNLVAEAVA